MGLKPCSLFLFYTRMITNVTIVDNQLTITSDTTLSKVYIDHLGNLDNLYSTTDDDHTYVLQASSTSLTVDLTTLEPELDRSAFVVSDGSNRYFYYDEVELYQKEICLLTEFCSTCLDKEQKEREVLFMMKHELLKYAVANNLFEDQIAIYQDIARMLGIDLKYNAVLPCNCRCGKKQCINGCCSIC